MSILCDVCLYLGVDVQCFCLVAVYWQVALCQRKQFTTLRRAAPWLQGRRFELRIAQELMGDYSKKQVNMMEMWMVFCLCFLSSCMFAAHRCRIWLWTQHLHCEWSVHQTCYCWSWQDELGVDDAPFGFRLWFASWTFGGTSHWRSVCLKYHSLSLFVDIVIYYVSLLC